MKRTATVVVHCVALLALAVSGNALAGRPVRESLNSVLARTERAVVVRVLAVHPLRAERFARAIEIEATPQEMLIGQLPDDSTLFCRYAEGVVHRRGDATLSPLVSGSGEEFDVRRGAHVILLLAAPAAQAANPLPSTPADETAHPDDDALQTDADDAARPACDILRIEPVENRRLVLRRRQP